MALAAGGCEHPWAKLLRACRLGCGGVCRARCGCEVTGRLSLVGHSADVAAVMQVLLGSPVIAHRLATLLGRPALTPDDRARLVALTALHDVGKINVGFQLGPFDRPVPRTGHIAPMLALLAEPTHGATRVLHALTNDGGLGRLSHLTHVQRVLPRRTDRPPEPLRTVLAHHGSLPERGPVDPRWWCARDDYDPIQACRGLVEAIETWVPTALDPVPIAWSSPFSHAFAGLVTLADWLGSDETRFPFTGNDRGPDGVQRFGWALQQARALVAARGLAPEPKRSRARGCAWQPRPLIEHDTPSAAQAAMLSLAPPPPIGRLCVIEDETGSGKTEAALIHFLDLFRRGVVDGLYFALPTRAAATQIHRRVEAALCRLLGPDAPHVTLAVPGYLDPAVAALTNPNALYPDNATDLRRDALWSSERPKRYLASWVAVGTIDQVLLGGLQVRHALLRSAAMLRLLLVVDEVHGSDRYMGAILRRLLEQHRRAGGHALLMSATLGASARARFFQLTGKVAVPPRVEAVATAYPAVWTDGERLPGSGTSRPARVVTVELVADWDQTGAIVGRVVEAARAGARVLVIRNAVRLVIEMQRALEAVAPDPSFGIDAPAGRVPCPHHARYAPEDRMRLDAALEAVLGRDAPRLRGSVTIASQTAEQSLDIDADLLITDLCPADVLLQRIGRLHRHGGRARPPGFEQARVVVLAPAEETLASSIDATGQVRRGPLALGLVYPDLLGVLATRRALVERPVLCIPRDNRALVEAATHETELADLAARLGGVWHAHWQHLWGAASALVQQARHVWICWEKPIAALPELGGAVKTRLGLDDRTVPLPEGTVGPFGGMITSLPLSGRWLAGVPADAEPKIPSGASGELMIVFGDRAFTYDRLGLRLAART